jgi:hypothetical protein
LPSGTTTPSASSRHEDGRWVAVSSGGGWHLARITARHAGEPADFAAMSGACSRTGRQTTMQAQLAEALQAISGRYDIRLELSTPPADWDAERIETARLALGSNG